jgi:site-specific DNA recombinase
MAPRVYAALYIRKSNETEEQKSLKDQIAEGREYCKRMGWTLRDEHIFIDEESAYLKPAEKRQSFIEMVNLACAKKPLFSRVVVWKVDRFARRTHDGFKYWQMLADNDVELFSMTQTFGEGAGGKLNLGIHFMMAEYYSDDLSENVRRGLRNASILGYWTSSKAPFGYERYSDDDKNHRLRIVEEDAAIVRHMFECSTKGWGLRRIGAEVGFSDGRVWSTLHNENYTGDRVQRNKTNREKVLLRVPNAHPAIVTKAIFEKAQRCLNSRDRAKNREAVTESLYKGILRCVCGSAMRKSTVRAARGRTHGYVYYQCRAKMGGSGCLSANVREDKITDLLLDLIADKLFSDKAIKTMYKLAETKRQNGDLEKATRHLHRELADNKGQQRRLIELVRDDIVPMDEIKDDMHQLKVDADALEAKLDFAPEEPIKPAVMKTLVNRLKRDLLTDNVKRHDAMRELIQKIVVDLPQLHITTSLMAVEETYELFYHTPPVVPKDYSNLDVQQKRNIVSNIRRFVGEPQWPASFYDNRERSKPINQWKSAQLDPYIANYLNTELFSISSNTLGIAS